MTMLFEIEVKDLCSAEEFIKAYNKEWDSAFEIKSKLGSSRLQLVTEKSQSEIIAFAVELGLNSMV